MLKTTSSTLFAERECRVPILNGVTLNDGSVTWVLKDALEEIFNSDGERSVSLTGLAPELDQVSVSERLLTSFYLGRSPKFSHHGLPSSHIMVSQVLTSWSPIFSRFMSPQTVHISLCRQWSGSLEDNAEAITDLNTDAAFASPAHQVKIEQAPSRR